MLDWRAKVREPERLDTECVGLEVKYETVYFF